MLSVWCMRTTFARTVCACCVCWAFDVCAPPLRALYWIMSNLWRWSLVFLFRRADKPIPPSSEPVRIALVLHNSFVSPFPFPRDPAWAWPLPASCCRVSRLLPIPTAIYGDSIHVQLQEVPVEQVVKGLASYRNSPIGFPTRSFLSLLLVLKPTKAKE